MNDFINQKQSSHTKPLISIITVVKNGSKTLERAFESIFSQSFLDYEYIVVDGASTDSTIDLIHQYEDKITRWISETDNGVYDAMNKGVKMARGKWVYFLGSDDYLLCNLETVANYLKDGNTIYYGDVYRPLLKRTYDGKFTAYKLACRNICHQSIFYPNFVWEKYRFNMKYRVMADYELNMRCFSDPDIRMKYLPYTIAVFDDETGLSPSQHDKIFEANRLRLIKAHFSFPIYLLAMFHFFLVKLLTQLRLDRFAKKIYHHLLGRYRNINNISNM